MQLPGKKCGGETGRVRGCTYESTKDGLIRGLGSGTSGLTTHNLQPGMPNDMLAKELTAK